MMKTSLALVLLLVALASANYGTANYGNANYNSVPNSNLLNNGIGVVIPIGANGQLQVIMPGQTHPQNAYFGANPPYSLPGQNIAEIDSNSVTAFDQQGNRYNVQTPILIDQNGQIQNLGIAVFREISSSNLPIGYAGAGAAGAAAGA